MQLGQCIRGNVEFDLIRYEPWRRDAERIVTVRNIRIIIITTGAGSISLLFVILRPDVEPNRTVTLNSVFRDSGVVDVDIVNVISLTPLQRGVL